MSSSKPVPSSAATSSSSSSSSSSTSASVSVLAKPYNGAASDPTSFTTGTPPMRPTGPKAITVSERKQSLTILNTVAAASTSSAGPSSKSSQSSLHQLYQQSQQQQQQHIPLTSSPSTLYPMQPPSQPPQPPQHMQQYQQPRKQSQSDASSTSASASGSGGGDLSRILYDWSIAGGPPRQQQQQHQQPHVQHQQYSQQQQQQQQQQMSRTSSQQSNSSSLYSPHLNYGPPALAYSPVPVGGYALPPPPFPPQPQYSHPPPAMKDPKEDEQQRRIRHQLQQLDYTVWSQTPSLNSTFTTAPTPSSSSVGQKSSRSNMKPTPYHPNIAVHRASLASIPVPQTIISPLNYPTYNGPGGSYPASAPVYESQPNLGYVPPQATQPPYQQQPAPKPDGKAPVDKAAFLQYLAQQAGSGHRLQRSSSLSSQTPLVTYPGLTTKVSSPSAGGSNVASGAKADGSAAGTGATTSATAGMDQPSKKKESLDRKYVLEWLLQQNAATAAASGGHDKGVSSDTSGAPLPSSASPSSTTLHSANNNKQPDDNSIVYVVFEDKPTHSSEPEEPLPITKLLDRDAPLPPTPDERSQLDEEPFIPENTSIHIITLDRPQADTFERFLAYGSRGLAERNPEGSNTFDRLLSNGAYSFQPVTVPDGFTYPPSLGREDAGSNSDTFDRFLAKGVEGMTVSDNSQPAAPQTLNRSHMGTFERLLANGASSFGPPPGWDENHGGGGGGVRVYSLPRGSMNDFEAMLKNGGAEGFLQEEADFFGTPLERRGTGASRGSGGGGTFGRPSGTLERLLMNGASSVGAPGGMRVFTLSRTLERRVTGASVASSARAGNGDGDDE
ncbi:hypothetical protein HDV05_002135 [Chytridiales sp. JEL 0842]|nr:hypothetical protein HDV05_002135 [Chytridiales sp. JEL 0842]